MIPSFFVTMAVSKWSTFAASQYGMGGGLWFVRVDLTKCFILLVEG